MDVMVGILIICHCNLGKELISAAELILGRIEHSDFMAISQISESEGLLKTIAEKIDTLDQGEGVLVLTDMFGGTPSNLSLSFLNDDRVEVLTGVNLPMVICAVQWRDSLSLKELGERAECEGRRSITLAGSMIT
jgi:PTS system mannose-specific IIA component